jgi:hypothetical protein
MNLFRRLLSLFRRKPASQAVLRQGETVHAGELLSRFQSLMCGSYPDDPPLLPIIQCYLVIENANLPSMFGSFIFRHLEDRRLQCTFIALGRFAIGLLGDGKEIFQILSLEIPLLEDEKSRDPPVVDTLGPVKN